MSTKYAIYKLPFWDNNITVHLHIFFVPNISVVCNCIGVQIYTYVCLFLSKTKEKIIVDDATEKFHISIYYYSILKEVLTNAYFMILHINSFIQKC